MSLNGSPNKKCSFHVTINVYGIGRVKMVQV